MDFHNDTPRIAENTIQPPKPFQNLRVHTTSNSNFTGAAAGRNIIPFPTNSGVHPRPPRAPTKQASTAPSTPFSNIKRLDHNYARNIIVNNTSTISNRTNAVSPQDNTPSDYVILKSASSTSSAQSAHASTVRKVTTTGFIKLEIDPLTQKKQINILSLPEDFNTPNWQGNDTSSWIFSYGGTQKTYDFSSYFQSEKECCVYKLTVAAAQDTVVTLTKFNSTTPKGIIIFSLPH